MQKVFSKTLFRSFLLGLSSLTLIVFTFLNGTGSVFGQRPAPAVNLADLEKQIAVLQKEVNSLSKSNEQLQKEMAGAKLLVLGLEKGLSSLQSDYKSHQHRSQFVLIPATNLINMPKSGSDTMLIPYITKNQHQNMGSTALNTSPPLN